MFSRVFVFLLCVFCLVLNGCVEEEIDLSYCANKVIDGRHYDEECKLWMVEPTEEEKMDRIIQPQMCEDINYVFAYDFSSSSGRSNIRCILLDGNFLVDELFFQKVNGKWILR